MERNDETLYLPSFGTERSHVDTTSDKLTSLSHAVCARTYRITGIFRGYKLSRNDC